MTPKTRDLPALASGLLLCLGLALPASAQRPVPLPPVPIPLDWVAAPNAVIEGKTYAQWSATWWQWYLALPDLPGHPGRCDAFYDVALGQSGDVWFLAGPLGTCQRTVSIPYGIKLFLPLINVEASSLEAAPFYGCTAAEQGASATAFANFIDHPFLTIDGRPLRPVLDYRFLSPQFSVGLPTPNFLQIPPGTTTSCPYMPPPQPMELRGVSNGYWAMISPLPIGQHTIHFGGTFLNTPFGTFSVDMSYDLTVY